MNWIFFGKIEGFINQKEILQDVKKLVYLKDTLKGGSAKCMYMYVILGISQTVENYA